MVLLKEAIGSLLKGPVDKLEQVEETKVGTSQRSSDI